MQTKRLLFSILFTFVLFQALQAQYITPGNNLSLTLDQLVSSSGGVVTFNDGTYFINNTLTVSATDTLRINEPATIRTASGIRLEVNGTIISNPTSGQVLFSAIDTTTVSTNFKGFRFDDSPGNVFRNTIVTHGGGLQLISSEVLFEFCTFRKNGSSNVSAVITYSSCSPVIQNCEFIENARSAIGSGANVSGSPHILYNSIINNTTDNSNRPQINIGPGASDTLYIIGNYIEGFYNNAGGIGLSNLLSTGNTKAVVKDNYVVNNRYGYAQIGSNISSVITDNVFLDNNIQNQPNLGGSGINFQASGTGNTAIVRRNIIAGNLWGITIQGVAQPNLGTAGDSGGNVFYENGNTGAIYALYNNTALPVDAIGNYWGTNDPIEAENFIFHQTDQASLGLVSYLPIQILEPLIQSFGFLVADNPSITTDVFGTIDQQNHTIEIILPAGTEVTSLIPQIGLSLGVITNPEGGIETDFSAPVSYDVITPHGENTTYIVNVTVEAPTFTVSFNITGIEGLPVSDASILFNGTNYPAGVYVFENLLAGTYSYEVAHPLYNSASGIIEVIDQNISIDVALIPLSYSITFEVTDSNGNDISDASITFDGTTYPAGIYLFENVLPGTYNYSVSRSGYATYDGSVTIIDQNITVDVVMQMLVYNLTFTIIDDSGNPLEAAEVILQNVGSQSTDVSGIVIFDELLPGSYTYDVSKSGYLAVNGTAQIVDANVNITVILQIISSLDDNIFSNIRLFPNPTSDYIILQGLPEGVNRIRIVGLNGKNLIQLLNPESGKRIALTGLPSGSYFIVIEHINAKKVMLFQKQ